MDNIVDNSRTIKFIEELGTNSEASVLKLKAKNWVTFHIAGIIRKMG